jgi:predicted nucleic acid-binding protein
LVVEASHETLITTDLAIYEACNSIWKLVTLLKSISLEEALDVAVTLKDLAIRAIIRPMDFSKIDISNTLMKACKETLTFYDASYIASAQSRDSILVTEDEKLQKLAKKFVKTITYKDLERRIAHSQ